MKIDLASIAGVPGAHGRYAVDEALPATDGVEVVGPVTGEITVQNTGQLLLVRGRLAARVRSSCRRCLADTEEPLEIEVTEEFASEGAAAEVDTVDREDPERSAIHDYVLDVSELVRQQVAVHLPMSSLCRTDCQGICPQCGRNLNQGPCGCEVDLGPGPFAKLKEMLEKKAGRE